MYSLNIRSRTNSTLLNIATGIGGKLLTLVFAFTVRTVFVRQLGAEYNGLNGLIGNIMSFLCLADIGLQNVLNFSLYASIEKHDINAILRTVKSFRKLYFYFAVVIAALGIVVIPFLPFIVKSTIAMGEVYRYYALYLFNSIATYFWIYKTTLLYADQSQHIINIITLVFKILTYVFQIATILIWKNLYAYLCIQIIFTVLQNLVLSYITEKKYPFLHMLKKIQQSKIDSNQRCNISDTIKYRISDVLLNNTDSIIISAILGTVFSGYYGNYYMLFQYVEGFVYTMGTGVIASVGNLVQQKDTASAYKNFKVTILVYAIVASACVSCFYNCVQDFIPIWIGEEYLLSKVFLAMMTAVFYLNISMGAIKLYREAMGLFSRVSRSMFAAALINICLSMALGRLTGLIGIVIATFVAKIATQYWYEPLLVYKEKFKERVRQYHTIQIRNLALSVLSLMLSSFLCNMCSKSLCWIFIKVIISISISVISFCVVYYRSDEFGELKIKAKSFVKKRGE